MEADTRRKGIADSNPVGKTRGQVSRVDTYQDVEGKNSRRLAAVTLVLALVVMSTFVVIYQENVVSQTQEELKLHAAILREFFPTTSGSRNHRQNNWARIYCIRPRTMTSPTILAFSIHPLRYLSLFSVSISAILMFYAGFIIVQKLFFSADIAAGWTSLMFVISFLFAILFLFLALLSEYIGRILTETKNRPLYYIREEIGGTEFKVRNIVDRD